MKKSQKMVRDWLNRAYNIDFEINTLLIERNRARERICGISAHGVSSEKVQSSKNNTSEDAMINYLSYDERIMRKLNQLYKIKSEVSNAVNAVENPVHRQLLQLRYLQYCKWERIAEKMGFSDKWVRTRLHNDALSDVRKYIAQTRK